MKRRVAALLLIAFIVAGPARAAEPTPPVETWIANPTETRGADYLVLAADRFVGPELARLAAHRTRTGHNVAIVRTSAVGDDAAAIVKTLKRIGATWKPAPRFLLLVGDSDALPPVVRKPLYEGEPANPDIATDQPFARAGGKHTLAIGRIPCATSEQLGRLVDRTIAYETTRRAGPWQRQLAMVGNVPAYGPFVDAFVEAKAAEIVRRNVPPRFRLTAAYASPASPYCPYPPTFGRRARALLGAGPLAYLYVGHGAPRNLMPVVWRGQAYPILEAGDAPIGPEAPRSIAIMMTCSTGWFDGELPCLGEALLLAEAGPVAFVGCTRKSHPYANMLVGDALVGEFLSGPATLGEALVASGRVVEAHKMDPFVASADVVAVAMTNGASLKDVRTDTLDQYILLGDPALRIRRPEPLEVTVEGETITVRAPEGVDEVNVALTVPHNGFAKGIPPLPTPGDGAVKVEAVMNRRFEAANARTLREWTAAAKGGTATVDFDQPGPGSYFIKAWAGGRAGGVRLEIAEDGESIASKSRRRSATSDR